MWEGYPEILAVSMSNFGTSDCETHCDDRNDSCKYRAAVRNEPIWLHAGVGPGVVAGGRCECG